MRHTCKTPYEHVSLLIFYNIYLHKCSFWMNRATFRDLWAGGVSLKTCIIALRRSTFFKRNTNPSRFMELPRHQSRSYRMNANMSSFNSKMNTLCYLTDMNTKFCCSCFLKKLNLSVLSKFTTRFFLTMISGWNVCRQY